ncbi:hypothetical protein TFLX_04655 [Thermoflexales bacterium]|nr:hypothetical protein TFLX_04655 [Thermoflexales bacterium]
MISLPRIFISLALYGAYIFAIIALAEPRKNEALYLLLLAAGSALFLWGMFSGFLTTPGNYRRLKAHGVEAEATILSISDTGATVNKNPYVKLRLRVEPLGIAAYETEVKAMVSRISIPRPGDGVRVKFDPNKPEDVIVV